MVTLSLPEPPLLQEEEEQEEAPHDQGASLLQPLVKDSDAAETVLYTLRCRQTQITLSQVPSRGLSFQIWPAAYALCWILEDIFGTSGMHSSELPRLHQWIESVGSQKNRGFSHSSFGHGCTENQSSDVALQSACHDEGSACVTCQPTMVAQKLEVSVTDQITSKLDGLVCTENHSSDVALQSVCHGEGSACVTFQPTMVAQKLEASVTDQITLKLHPSVKDQTEHCSSHQKEGTLPAEAESSMVEQVMIRSSPRCSDGFDKVEDISCEIEAPVTSMSLSWPSPIRVLELGAGTGMVGILSAVLGADVTITDLPHVTANILHNTSLNEQTVKDSGNGGNVCVKTLRWGNLEDMQTVGHAFDVILASDVVYYDHLFQPLLDTLKWLLPAQQVNNGSPSPCLLLAHVRRWKKDSHFFRKASRLFHVREVHKQPHPANPRTGVVVYCFTCKK